MSTQRIPRYTIDHEGMQRVSTLGVIDPDTGVRHYWCPDSAIDFLRDLQANEDFTRERYCNRCDAYDGELAIKPWQKRLPRLKRRAKIKVDPVALPWIPGKPAQDVHVRGSHKSRPGRPQNLDACHMCLLSFLDEQEPPELTPEQTEALKAEFRSARDELGRLHRARANENPDWLSKYIEKRLSQSRARLARAADACRDAGFEPARPRTRFADETLLQREEDESPGV